RLGGGRTAWWTTCCLTSGPPQREPMTSSGTLPGVEQGLRVEALLKDYPTRSGPLPVLRGITFALQPGESLAAMGPSGSGKRTLLPILAPLAHPTAGTVRLAGQDPFALPEKQLADFRNRHVGLVFQDHHLLPQCSVLENVLIPTLVGRDD